MLHACLTGFAERFNAHGRVGRLVRGWDRRLRFEATDTGTTVDLLISDSRIVEVIVSGDASSSFILLQAIEAVLIEIFGGGRSPTLAVLDGDLAVFADERDKIKMEAIAMVLWGIPS